MSYSFLIQKHRAKKTPREVFLKLEWESLIPQQLPHALVA